MDPMFQSAKMGALPQIAAATLSSATGGEQYGPRFNFRGFPKICRNAPKALNQTSRKKLWEISENLIKDVWSPIKTKKVILLPYHIFLVAKDILIFQSN